MRPRGAGHSSRRLRAKNLRTHDCVCLLAYVPCTRPSAGALHTAAMPSVARPVLGPSRPVVVAFGIWAFLGSLHLIDAASRSWFSCFFQAIDKVFSREHRYPHTALRLGAEASAEGALRRQTCAAAQCAGQAVGEIQVSCGVMEGTTRPWRASPYGHRARRHGRRRDESSVRSLLTRARWELARA